MTDVRDVRCAPTPTLRRRSSLAAVTLVCVLVAGCRSGPQQWGPFRGQVVDAETGRPIAGAHVMVSWERDNPNPVHWTQSFYDAQETVTDNNGRFEIPRERRVMTVLVSEPRFGVFAPGYLWWKDEVVPPNGRRFVDPTTVTMQPGKTREERCKYEPHGLGAFVSRKEAPRFAAAVDDYIASLRCAEKIGR